MGQEFDAPVPRGGAGETAAVTEALRHLVATGHPLGGSTTHGAAVEPGLWDRGGREPLAAASESEARSMYADQAARARVLRGIVVEAWPKHCGGGKPHAAESVPGPAWRWTEAGRPTKASACRGRAWTPGLQLFREGSSPPATSVLGPQQHSTEAALPNEIGGLREPTGSAKLKDRNMRGAQAVGSCPLLLHSSADAG
mmetsp:Transcript_64428/g.179182  ORF Transcript_64428/g.179182 Transcript_64428/m.179182 type:complete len:198 (+) Transcript_64428:1217-1810(+)